MKLAASSPWLVLTLATAATCAIFATFACSRVSQDAAFEDDLKTSAKPVVKAGPITTNNPQPVPIPYPNLARGDVADGGPKPR